MKTSLLLTLLLASTTLAFAQGKLQFANDSQHLVYFSPDTSRLAPGDAPVAGKGVDSPTLGLLSGAPSFVVALYAGVSPSALTLQTTTTFNGASEGRWNSVNLTGLPAGTAVWFQVEVYDSRYASAPAAAQDGAYWGESVVFSAVPQISIYASICDASSPVFSTWPKGTFQIIDMPPGNLGAIMLQAGIPAPPSIVYQPTNQMVLAGAPFSFSVTAAKVLSYQWRFNGMNLAGANGSVYWGFNAQLTNAGSYTVVVTNSVGTVTSDVATLTVLLAGANATISQAVGVGVSISVASQAGLTYLLEYKNALNDPAWTPLPPAVTATGSVLVLQDTNAPVARRYYRVQRE